MANLSSNHRQTIVAVAKAVVIICAAVISFSALYDLAVLCGFRPLIAVLFPVMVDAGAAVALAGWRTSTFSRRVALALLFSTVAGNAVAHILVAYGLRPHWAIVVLVGGLAPAVLASTWHLTSHGQEDDDPDLDIVVEQIPSDIPSHPIDIPETPNPVEQAREMVANGAGRTRLMKELGLSEYEARQIVAASRNGKAVA